MILLKNAQIFDAETSYAPMDILVDGDKIADAAASIQPQEGWEVMDLTGCTLLPAFVDAHVHAGCLNRERNGYVDNIITKLAKKGVSLCKDDGLLCGLELEPYLEFLKTCKTPRHARVVTAGRYIDVDGGYGMGPGAHMPGMREPGKPVDHWGIQIETAQQAADAVTYQHNAGTDGVKIGIADHGNQMTLEQITAICDRAKSHGMWTTAHVGTSVALQKLVDGGIGEAAHTPSDRMPDELIATMVKRDISMITTVGALRTEIGEMDYKMHPGLSDEEIIAERVQRREVILENLKRFYEAGGIIAIGTDLMNSDEKAAIPTDELEALLSIGIPMNEVVRCGTANAVKVCGLDDEGFVREGMLANLIAIKGPLDDKFQKLNPPPFVMNQGVILTNDL